MSTIKRSIYLINVYICLQVHRRLDNLEILVESLSKVKNIEHSLVIFSHDFWAADINAFIETITEFR